MANKPVTWYFPIKYMYIRCLLDVNHMDPFLDPFYLYSVVINQGINYIFLWDASMVQNVKLRTILHDNNL